MHVHSRSEAALAGPWKMRCDGTLLACSAFLGLITILYAARLPIQHACVVMYCAVCVVNTDGGRRPGAALQMQCGRAGPPGTAQPGKVEWALPYCETIIFGVHAYALSHACTCCWVLHAGPKLRLFATMPHVRYVA